MRFFAALVFVALASPAFADDGAPEAPWAALAGGDASQQILQNRKFSLTHELAFLGGTLPTDPYYKGMTGGVGYTLHLTDHVAWEIGQFTYSYNLDTKLKRNVERTAGFTQAGLDFPQIVWVAASHLVVKPFYGKEAVFNTEVVHLELYAQAGPALVGRSGEVSAIVPGIDSGLGVRVWLSKTFSWRIEASELVYFDPSAEGVGLYQTPHFQTGIAASLWSDE
jgi:outer membrane beta-barrel protein